MVYAQPRIYPGEWDAQTPQGFWDSNRSPNLGQMIRSCNNQQKKKKEICQIMDFAVLADYRVKLKENKKKNKYPDLARGLKKLWNIRVVVIPIVFGDLGTVTKGLVEGLEDLKIRGQVETIQTTVLLRSARILKRVQETCCHSNSIEKPSANAGVKNSKNNNNNNDNNLYSLKIPIQINLNRLN